MFLKSALFFGNLSKKIKIGYSLSWVNEQFLQKNVRLRHLLCAIFLFLITSAWSKWLGPIFIWCIYAAMSRRFAHFFLFFSNCVEMWKNFWDTYGCFFLQKVRILFLKKQANNLCKSVSPSMVARVSSSLLLWCKCDLKWE